MGVEGQKFPRAQVQSGGHVQHVQAAMPTRDGVAFGKGFGQPRNAFPALGIRENYTFTQKARDSESALHYFEARHYCGVLARFTYAISSIQRGNCGRAYLTVMAEKLVPENFLEASTSLLFAAAELPVGKLTKPIGSAVKESTSSRRRVLLGGRNGSFLQPHFGLGFAP